MPTCTRCRSSGCTGLLQQVRLFTCIVVTSHPPPFHIPGLDVQRSEFCNADVYKVPVIRVYGSTSAGKTLYMYCCDISSSLPHPRLDVQRSEFRNADVYKVPVIRVYGSTPAGKALNMYCCVPPPLSPSPGWTYSDQNSAMPTCTRCRSSGCTGLLQQVRLFTCIVVDPPLFPILGVDVAVIRMYRSIIRQVRFLHCTVVNPPPPSW